jgi:hypothetical protein
MNRNIVLIFSAALLSMPLAACSNALPSEGLSQATPAPAAPPGETSDLGQLVYLAAQTLVDRAPSSLGKDRPIVVTTMVSIDDFNESSTIGRLASQLISNRLSQRGYLVHDITVMRALDVEPATGELILSRDATKISASFRAQAVVAGTYAIAGHEVFFNIRLLKPDDGTILSSADVVIPLDRNTQQLVAASN